MKVFFQTIFIIGINLQAQPIDKAEAVNIGGIPQWIKIEGNNNQAPVLLFLHGGPGNSVMNYSNRFTSELKQHFIVVQWDQRQSGETATLSKDAPVTLDMMIRDAEEMVNYLYHRFGNRKIYVAGHSWGGYLALRVAGKKPSFLAACVAVSPMVAQVKSDSLTLYLLKQRAQKNTLLLNEELNQVVVPFENVRQLYFHRKGLSVLMHTIAPKEDRVMEWGKTWLSVFTEASQTSLTEIMPTLECPTYFMVGRKDMITHPRFTENYYQRVVCPEKKLYWFEQSAHNPHLAETRKFEQLIIDLLKKTPN